MKIINLKPSQKLIRPDRNNLSVHKASEVALCAWHRLRPKVSDINFYHLDKFYRPPLRLIAGFSDTFYFINEFHRVDQILSNESSLNHPCLIMPEHTEDIQRLAWIEVIELSFLAGIYHPDLYKTLKEIAPTRIICELMGIKALSVKGYCDFVGISQSNYEYQQCRSVVEDSVLGLPTSMNWLSGPV